MPSAVPAPGGRPQRRGKGTRAELHPRPTAARSSHLLAKAVDAAAPRLYVSTSEAEPRAVEQVPHSAGLAAWGRRPERRREAAPTPSSLLPLASLRLHLRKGDAEGGDGGSSARGGAQGRRRISRSDRGGGAPGGPRASARPRQRPGALRPARRRSGLCANKEAQATIDQHHLFPERAPRLPARTPRVAKAGRDNGPERAPGRGRSGSAGPRRTAARAGHSPRS